MNKTIINNILDGSINLENGNYIEALSNYKDVLKTQNDYNLLATYKSGVCFMKLQQYDKAIVFFKEVLQVNPLHRNTLKNLSICYRHLDKIKNMLSICDIIYNLDNKLSLESIQEGVL